MVKKSKKRGSGAYLTTLILLSILIAVMSLIIFIPLKSDKQGRNIQATGFVK
jgi:hypothetical protein